MKLEEIFKEELSKKQSAKSKALSEMTKRWDRDRAKIESIYNNLSFLENYGVKVEKVNCTEFSEKHAFDGFYPYLRLPIFLATFSPLHDAENDLHGRANGEFTGSFTCEKLIRMVAKRVNLTN